MALRAANLRMTALKRVCRLLMKGKNKGRRFEPLLRVARGAIAAIGPEAELGSVLFPVTVEASGMRNGRVEIGGSVAFPARQVAMAALQREPCPVMIERADKFGNILPPQRLVACGAWLLKRAAVRIAMARSAGCGIGHFVAHRPAGKLARAVALFARHTHVHPGQRIRGLFMPETGSGLPGQLAMAAKTVLLQLACMHVAMARRAGLAEAEVGAIQILDADLLPRLDGDPLGCVTLGTLDPGVFPLQRKPGQPVVEFFTRGRPRHNVEIAAVVFGVAPGAPGFDPPALHHTRMVAHAEFEARRDLLVAAHTLKNWFARPEHMALQASE
jgi:hypothetical protein